MDGGGFTGAIWSKKTKYFSGLNAQRKIAQSSNPLALEEAAILLAHIVKLKSCRAGHR